MAKVNSFQALAAEAADRIDLARAQGEQLSLLGDAEPSTVDADGKGRGRGKGKALSQLREHLANRGYRLPEDVLAQMAGLASRDDAITTAMVAAERIVTWAYADKVEENGAGLSRAVTPSPTAMLRAFELVYTSMIRAADALLPYGLAKVTPDVIVGPVVPIMSVPAAPSHGDRALAARDVTPRSGVRMVPADVALRIEQNQGVAAEASAQSDGGSRTG
jgi:hypothetical protein